jgi:hypothetical protein
LMSERQARPLSSEAIDELRAAFGLGR